MNQKALKILEFEKIKEILAGFAGSAAGKELCRRLAPMTHIEDIRLAQKETSDAFARLVHNGPVSFA